MRNKKIHIFQLCCNREIGPEALKKYPDIQFIDPSNIASVEQIKFAIDQAYKAFERKENLSNNFLVEVLVRASAQRQIKKALELLGLKKSRKVIAVCEKIPRKMMQEYKCRRSEILSLDGQKFERLKKIYDIGDEEISAVAGEGFEEKKKALVEIIKERIALIPTL
jgi:KEOPS complex subunit Cgi121